MLRRCASACSPTSPAGATQAAAQIEQLREGRDRLLGAYEVVQRTVDHAVEQLRLAAPDAHAVTAPERVACRRLPPTSKRPPSVSQRVCAS